MTEAMIQEVLSNSIVLGDCSLDARQALLHVYKKGQIVNDRINGKPMVGVIVSGDVEVFSVAMDGREVCLNHLGKGDCFGIANLFEGTYLDTVLKCIKATKVMFFPKDIILKRIEDDPAFAIRFIRLYSQKVNFLIQRIELLTMHTAQSKLQEYLLSNCGQNGVVRIEMSRDSLAKLLGISRAALYRELARLEEQGLVEVQKQSIQILDCRRLEAMLNNAN